MFLLIYWLDLPCQSPGYATVVNASFQTICSARDSAHGLAPKYGFTSAECQNNLDTMDEVGRVVSITFPPIFLTLSGPAAKKMAKFQAVMTGKSLHSPYPLRIDNPIKFNGT